MRSLGKLQRLTRYAVVAFATGVISMANATVFQAVRSPWAGVMPVVQPLSPATILAASSDLSNATIKIQHYKRTSTGSWGVLTDVNSIPFSTLSSDQWIPQQISSDANANWLLISGASCEESGVGPCKINEHAIIRLSQDGKSTINSTIIKPTCESPKAPEMNLLNNALLLLDGCGTTLQISENLDVKTVSGLTGKAAFSLSEPSILWNWRTEDGQTIVQLSQAETGSIVTQTSFTGNASICSEILPGNNEIFSAECIVEKDNNNEVNRITFSDKIGRTVVSQQSPSTLSLVKHDGHTYAQQLSGKILLLTNTKTSDVSQEFSRRELTLNTSSAALQNLQRHPQAKIEASGFYAVLPAVQGQDRVYFFFYDGIPQNFGPFLLSSAAQALPSGIRIELPWRVMDEESLPESLTFTNPESPAWIEFDSARRLAIAEPTHKDTGRYTFAQSISDPKGNVLDVNWDLTVTLSPYTLMVYEPNWFDKWKINGPIPYDSLIKQVKRLPVTEDSPFSWSFTLQNRTADEFHFSGDAPDFIKQTQGDDGSLTFSGTALQQHTGVHQAQIVIKDIYSEDSTSISIPMEVIEVDETFTIASTPLTDATINTPYSYQISVDDEETKLEDFDIQVVEKPAFLTLERTMKRLDGTPTRKDLGSHTVAIILTDKAGHRLLHQWKVVVKEPVTEESSGGGFSALWTLSLAGIAIYRRRRADNHSF